MPVARGAARGRRFRLLPGNRLRERKMSMAPSDHHPTVPGNSGGTTAATLIDNFTEFSLRWVPDSMVFVLVLTIGVYALSLIFSNHGPMELIDDYAKGFWILLTFSMEMALLLVTGFAVADSKYVKRGIVALVDWPKTRTGMILLYIVLSAALWWCHWGIGTMASIIMGRQIALRRKDLGLDYAYITAIAYAVVVCANGPSQAAQLLVATPGHFMEKVTGVIPLTLTTFNPALLIAVGTLFVTIPIVLLWIMPNREHSKPAPDGLLQEFAAIEVESEDISKLRPAERWDRSRILQTIVAIGGLIWVARYVYAHGIGQLNLDTLNFIFLFIGLLLHGSPHSFIGSVKRAVPSTYGIIIQFPMYAGIFGMISFSGMAGVMAHWFVSFSTHATYSWIIFLYTGFVDFFVPSGGSKFVIEAPYIIPAAQQLGISPAQVVNSYTAGSLWVNLIQPFWALPTLAAFKMRFQDILPYTFVVWVLTFIVYTFTLLMFPGGL
jgi:short-chain fatty acids transporter